MGLVTYPDIVLPAWGGQQEEKSFRPSFHVVAKVDFACFKHWGHLF